MVTAVIAMVVVGDKEFIRDADKTRSLMNHYIVSAIEDMQSTMARIARERAPGKLGEESVGVDGVVHAEGNYRGVVGVRNTPAHTRFVYFGTGVFGPTGKPYTMNKTQTNPAPNYGVDRTGRINPAVGNVFKIPAGNGRGFMIGGRPFYFRKQVTVQGQKPQPYLDEAFEIARNTEVPVRVLRLAKQITN